MRHRDGRFDQFLPASSDAYVPCVPVLELKAGPLRELWHAAQVTPLADPSESDLRREHRSVLKEESARSLQSR
jgi:hypothetical protein